MRRPSAARLEINLNNDVHYLVRYINDFTRIFPIKQLDNTLNLKSLHLDIVLIHISVYLQRPAQFSVDLDREGYHFLLEEGRVTHRPGGVRH